MPVWTAFITDLVNSPRWLTRPNRKVIHLTELDRYIFTDDYEQQLGPNGQHELCFLSSVGIGIDAMFDSQTNL